LIHKTAVVSPKAKLGPYVFIGAGCRIEDGVRISNSIIYAGVEVKVLAKFKENIRASVI
jgi:NDP-sugar pyrophosphorylase family protein